MGKLEKIIKEEISKFLSEGRGTPNAIKSYVEELVREFGPLLSEYIKVMSDKGMESYSFTEEMVFKELSEELPIDKLTLNFNIKIHPGSGKVMIDGFADRNLGIKEDKLNPTIQVDLEANPDITDLGDQLDDFLTHEMTHVHEFNQRQKSKAQTKGDFINYITSKEMRKSYPKAWQKLLTMIYHTIDFEVNARVSQVAKMSQKLREQGKDQNEIIDTIKKSEPWEILEEWEKFNPKEIVDHLDALIDHQGIREKGYDVEKIINAYKKGISTTFDSTNIELTPKEIGFLNKTERMAPMEFLEYWDKQFKKESIGYRKRLMKAMGS